jgi:protein-disulfide isomerase
VRFDRRLWVALVVAAAFVVAAVIGALATRGGEEQLDAGATLPDATEVERLLGGIPQLGPILGRRVAPVTLVEFVDMQCPFCREFEADVMPELVKNHVRERTVRVELRGLAFIGPDSERGLRAVLAAGLQNRLYEMKALLFANQGAENSGWLSEGLVEAAARSIPELDVQQLLEDMDSAAVTELVADHAAEAERRGVNSTPTVLVGRTGGELRLVQLASASDLAAIERAIAAAGG